MRRTRQRTRYTPLVKSGHSLYKHTADCVVVMFGMTNQCKWMIGNQLIVDY